MRRKKVCFVGYGSTEYSRKSEASVLWYYAEAIRDALKQTGLQKKDIHGLSITTQVSPDYSPHVAEQLGLEVDWVLNGDYGGAGGVMSVRRAADAIELRPSRCRRTGRRQFLRQKRSAPAAAGISARQISSMSTATAGPIR